MIYIQKGNKFSATTLDGSQIGNCIALSDLDEDGWIEAKLESIDHNDTKLWINLNNVSMCAVVI